ncbi:MAG TPA: SRPBCC family protein [Pyrinomonadaceae bacterium]|nr:SRPBCC family protein [Pyrinomonadaceae bacterium]
MPTFVLETDIAAAPERCFAILRDPRLHPETTVDHEGELAIGQIVRFESRFVGMRTLLELEVTEFDPPNFVTDELRNGIFREFRHRHEFRAAGKGTLMIDTVTWTLPVGPLGRLFDGIAAARLRSVITARNARLKALAEGD